jgi:hypothetical protein
MEENDNLPIRGEGKDKIFPVLNYHAMKMYGEVEITPLFLISAFDDGECSASHAGRFTPEEGDPGTRWIGGWVSPRDDMD